MNDWLSLTAMARRLQIPEPTARRYAKLFASYLPHRKIGRMTMYAPDAGSILTRISELYSKGHKKEEVEALLQKELPKTIDIDAPTESQALVRSDNSELQAKLVQFLEVVSDQSKKIDALMERDNQTSATIALLEQRLGEETSHRQRLQESSTRCKQALCKLYHAHKDHHAMITALREHPVAENSSGNTTRLNERLDQLEEMFLDDMGKLQQLMNHVLTSSDSK
ncbi:hypothetical protein [Desulfoplanes sp.]